jgi:hypothetical protein
MVKKITLKEIGDSRSAHVKGGNMKRLVMISVLWLGAGAVDAGEQPASERYVQGIGEFMMATQLRHAKLWFAGEAQNWELAEYEIDEIKEGLEDASRVHPTLDGLPIAEMIKAHTEAPLDDLFRAVEAKKSADFIVAFDRLTAGCNSCYTEARHAFIKIQHPTMPPVSNQVFSPIGK